jgi:DNA gyrase subunit B
MTDADVDGSHIRTLLLTFFYRQMNEVISRGNLFIAQPPLYKLKKGKMERYIKNEKEFTEIIIGSGVENVTVDSKNGKSSKAEDVKALIVRVRDIQPSLEELEMERLDKRVIVGLAEAAMVFPEDAWKREKLTEMLPRVEAAIKNRMALAPKVEIVDDLEGEVAFKVTTRQRGVQYQTLVTRRLWISEKIDEIRKVYYDALQIVGEGPFTITATGESRELEKVDSIEQVADFIDQRGRKGVSITRYKGLGEMNPEQLWETTMDPTNRRLLKVTVDDAIDADQIFTVLMGDEVEPRRKFIEENALKIRNLDI